MPGEEDAPGFEVQIHQIEGDATLEVAIDAVQDDLTSDVDYLEVREVRLGNCLVNGLVLFYTAKEIEFGLFWRSGRIVRVPRTNLERNICGDYSWVIAHRFYENRHYSPLAGHPRFDESSAHRYPSEVSTCGASDTCLRFSVLFVASRNTG